MKIIVKNYSYRGRNFTIIHDQGFYMAIEDKYLDENGCTKQILHGSQLFPAREAEDCMKLVNDRCDIDFYVASGMSKEEAFAKVFDIPFEMAAAVLNV